MIRMAAAKGKGLAISERDHEDVPAVGSVTGSGRGPADRQTERGDTDTQQQGAIRQPPGHKGRLRQGEGQPLADQPRREHGAPVQRVLPGDGRARGDPAVRSPSDYVLDGPISPPRAKPCASPGYHEEHGRRESKRRIAGQESAITRVARRHQGDRQKHRRPAAVAVRVRPEIQGAERPAPEADAIAEQREQERGPRIRAGKERLPDGHGEKPVRRKSRRIRSRERRPPP